ncbi:hypothetical protein DFR58_10697 [Anaerobacterium chartisolvens]|uniref:Uncharacterized protein n=1 Tax=Anaerobacterium chartisolvens TaxID=1297424 RepID=A0A369B8R9_9FIRM|nr:hypothetical protein [Anaerobacterium chartisolvens]RCX17929.1 hypothetical protein DFR58_10697 [Anaerobacterium chartisolvens]
MKLNGMLSKVMDNYLCLRGIASIKSLAKISEVNPDIQRDLLEDHKDEMKDFLERGEYAFFPEVVLSMNVGLSDEVEVFEDFAVAVDSADKGFNLKVGNVKVNFKPDENKLIDDRRQLKVAQIAFDENDIKLSRIDGNHRLSAANYLANDILIPFCLIIFPNEEEAKNNSRAIFHNINSKQIPLKLEQNIKIIIESSGVFTDSILEKPQPFGLHYRFTRELLCGNDKIDFGCFPHIKNFVYDNKYSFFTDLFRYLCKECLINNATAVEDVKNELVNVENAINEASIAASYNNSSIVGALAYYKLSDPDKHSRFIRWIAKNHIADAKTISIDDLISIFDKVYDNIPKNVFLARWYPATTDENYQNAQHRFNAIKSVVESLNLRLIDLGTQDGGTFDIRSVMYNEIKECDIFIADLTGCRHNVMVEVGYALKHVETGRMVFYFAPTKEYHKPPFDLDGFKYKPINDSAEIHTIVKPEIESILNDIK